MSINDLEKISKLVVKTAGSIDHSGQGTPRNSASSSDEKPDPAPSLTERFKTAAKAAPVVQN